MSETAVLVVGVVLVLIVVVVGVVAAVVRRRGQLRSADAPRSHDPDALRNGPVSFLASGGNGGRG